MKTGPILLIEDDSDDEKVMEEIIRELGYTNELIWFKNSVEAFNYLENTSQQPFVIFCDVNLPGQNGIAFKSQIDEDPQLRKKSIPFIFYSTSVNMVMVNEVYTNMTLQGFFQKKDTYEKIRATIKIILAYWSDCQHPNTL